MKRETKKRTRYVATALFALIGALGIGQLLIQRAVSGQEEGMVEAPRFEVDPMWPKPMPNGWLFGMTIGVHADAQDHVWIIHRGNDPKALDSTEYADRDGVRVGECCFPAPPVVEFDVAGNVVHAWGGNDPKVPAMQWPISNHGITVDHKGFVWIGGNGDGDAHILKFTKEGKFVAQYGKQGVHLVPGSPKEKPAFKGDSNDMNNFGRVAKITIDAKANEGYISDGYLNRRVAVIDLDTAKIKRYWGAYGNKPDDTDIGRYVPTAPLAKQFRNPVHCAEWTNDGLLYVCDRPNDRIQVFTKEGKFVKEAQFFPKTLRDGSTWDIAFSKDPEQKYMYVPDGSSERVYVIERKTLKLLTSFGMGGRQPGMFTGVHSITTDSKGNIFTTETYTGRRVQKFVYKGIGKVKAGVGGVGGGSPQGAVWPTAAK